MGTRQNQRVGVMEAIRKGRGEVDPRNLLGDRMLDPSLFNQRNEQRARLLACLQAAVFERLAVSMTADGSLSADYDDFPILRGRRGSVGPGLDHSYNWDVGRRADLIQ